MIQLGAIEKINLSS